jgi:Transposase IS116/IS110/IS902 family
MTSMPTASHTPRTCAKSLPAWRRLGRGAGAGCRPPPPSRPPCDLDGDAGPLAAARNDGRTPRGPHGRADHLGHLAGLAPVTRQSGRWQGKAFIQGGRAALRQALYRPAIVACRFNPDLKAKYDQLISSGKPAKLAITAVMHKLIVLANALIRDSRHWQPLRA